VPLTITLIIIIAFSSIVQSYQTQALHTARDERRQASRRARDAGKELEKSRAKAKKAQETEASRRRRAEETYQTHLDSVNSRLSQMGREAEDAKKEAEAAKREASHHRKVAFRISGRHGSPKGGSVHHEPLPDVHMPSTWHSASPNCSREASSADHSRENSRAVTGRRGSRKGSIIDALFHTPDKARKHSFDSDAGHIEHSSSTSPTEDARRAATASARRAS